MGQAPCDVHTDAVPDSSARWSEKGELQMNTKRSLTKTLALPALVTTFAMVVLLMTGLPASAAPVPWNISSGDLVISSGGDYAVTGSTTSHTIAVNTADAVTITLSNVSIDVSATSGRRALDSGGNVTLLLSGTNTLKSGANAPGIRVTAGEQLTVNNAASSAGSLSAYGGSSGAGIGGGNTEGGGAVTIVGGAVTATGGVTGAGIGGGSGGAGGSVSISGGSVTARSQGWAAGIGGGYLKDGGAVTISGGTVTVAGGDYSAGIGGAYAGDAGGLVTITGGTVTVNGGVFGAGIGGGYGGDGGDVVIRGGSIKAYGGSAGSNIGAGNLGAYGGTLTNGFGPVALRTIAGAVAPVDPMPVSFLIPVTGPGYGYDYVYTGAGHGGGDTNLYFYLPPGTSARTLRTERLGGHCRLEHPDRTDLGRQRYRRAGLQDRAQRRCGQHRLLPDRHGRSERHQLLEYRADRFDQLQLPRARLQHRWRFGLFQHGRRSDAGGRGGAQCAQQADRYGRLEEPDQPGVGGQCR